MPTTHVQLIISQIQAHVQYYNTMENVGFGEYCWDSQWPSLHYRSPVKILTFELARAKNGDEFKGQYCVRRSRLTMAVIMSRSIRSWTTEISRNLPTDSRGQHASTYMYINTLAEEAQLHWYEIFSNLVVLRMYWIYILLAVARLCSPISGKRFSGFIFPKYRKIRYGLLALRIIMFQV